MQMIRDCFIAAFAASTLSISFSATAQAPSGNTPAASGLAAASKAAPRAAAKVSVQRWVRYPASAAALSPRAELGKQIFFDASLSASGKMSCASCHVPSMPTVRLTALPCNWAAPTCASPVRVRCRRCAI
ncbi:cytochrome c peroxidase [Paraburkholderia atlantica]|uniref:cytochrome c peroxidase n=1 Tax=Paraburkholderia atlantica TaxID=2654982 RepID=UPI003D22B856